MEESLHSYKEGQSIKESSKEYLGRIFNIKFYDKQDREEIYLNFRHRLISSVAEIYIFLKMLSVLVFLYSQCERVSMLL